MIDYVANAIRISITCMSFAILERRYIAANRFVKSENSGGRCEARISIYESRTPLLRTSARFSFINLASWDLSMDCALETFKSNTRLSARSPLDHIVAGCHDECTCITIHEMGIWMISLFEKWIYFENYEMRWSGEETAIFLVLVLVSFESKAIMASMYFPLKSALLKYQIQYRNLVKRFISKLP